MEFSYTHSSRDEGVMGAVEFANGLFQNPEFWQEIAAAPPFTQTKGPMYTPALIAERMRACTEVVKVLHFRTMNPFSSTTAMVDPHRPFCIFLNTRKFRRSVASKTNTLVHEFVHVVDCFCDGPEDTGSFEYTHSRKHHPDRPNSAPYWIGNRAQEWWERAHGLSAETQVGLSTAPLDYAGAEKFGCDVGPVSDELIVS